MKSATLTTQPRGPLVSGSDMDHIVNFYSAALLKYRVQDTWHDTTASHIIVTLEQKVIALLRKPMCQTTVKFLNFRTPKLFAVNYLKFKQRGKTIEYFVQKMQME